MKQFLSSVISNIEVMPGVHLIWLESPEIATEASPGQFVMVSCGKDTLLRRPLSVHQVDGGKIALLFARVGKGTNWLSRQHEGDTVDLLGPLGNGFSTNPDSNNLLLVAGGIGIAPLSFLAQESLKLNRAIKMLIGGRTAAMCLPQYLLPDGLDVIYTTEDATLGKQGRVTTLVPDYFDWADQIFVCGPIPMYRNITDNFPQRKAKPVQISLEIMMACGRGLCYGCSIKTKQGMKKVCADGPVFELEDILW